MKMDADDTTGVTRQAVLALIEEKEKIESELSQLKGILDNNQTDLSEPLVDGSGFPRNDIDVYQVRHARHRIICLKNDHKAIMKRIEEGLHAIHANSVANGLEPMDTSTSNGPPAAEAAPVEPIVRVNLVSPGSPAEEAGLKEGDQIVNFGSINASNFKSLQDIGAVVRSSQGQAVRISVKRDDRVMRLVLTPRPWSGQGLLGCNIIPVDWVDR